ncbi:hypothetical protein ACODH8_00575 [Vagococcus fluvialis]|uniref:hypothetical protein n=1 Tax=Vagococcus fluvialis TaxID=2738 RepID=UPI003B5C4307
MKKIEKELNDNLKVLDVEFDRINKLRAESNKINDKVDELNKKMRESPSYTLTEQLGNLTSGRESFDCSLRQHEAEFERLVRSKYKKIKHLADNYINSSYKNVEEIEAAESKMRKLQNELLETNKELEELVEKHWTEATDVISATNIDRYADIINTGYINPAWWVPSPGMGYQLKKELEKEIKHQEE